MLQLHASTPLEFHGKIKCLAVDVKDKLLYIALDSGVVNRIELSRFMVGDYPDIRRILVTGDNAVLSMVLMDNLLATASGSDSYVQVWDLENRNALSIVGRQGGRAFHSMVVPIMSVLHYTTWTICCGGPNGNLWYMDLITNEIRVVEAPPTSSPCIITCLLLLSIKHKYSILSCDSGGRMIVWDDCAFSKRERVAILNGDRSSSTEALVPFDDYLGTDCFAVELQDGMVCCGGYEQLNIWQLNSPNGIFIMGFIGKVRRITALLQSADGVLWSGHFDGALRAWDVQAGTCTHTYRMHDEAITCLVHGLSGSFITGSSDGNIRVWTSVWKTYI